MQGKYVRVLVVSVLRTSEILSRSELPEEFKAYYDIFFPTDKARRKLPDDVEHAIDLELGKKPPFKPLYYQSPKELAQLQEYITKATKNDQIELSESEAGTPILFVPKKDSLLRLYIDYRGLNEITIKNRYLLPLISETLNRLRGNAFFTSLDLSAAYYRIKIKASDRQKTTFRTRYGHF